MSNNTGSSGGIGITGLLQVIFICAKIFGWEPIANWSWWWVFCPTWGTLLAVVILIAVLGFFIGGPALWERFVTYRKRTSL